MNEGATFSAVVGVLVTISYLLGGHLEKSAICKKACYPAAVKTCTSARATCADNTQPWPRKEKQNVDNSKNQRQHLDNR